MSGTFPNEAPGAKTGYNFTQSDKQPNFHGDQWDAPWSNILEYEIAMIIAGKGTSSRKFICDKAKSEIIEGDEKWGVLYQVSEFAQGDLPKHSGSPAATNNTGNHVFYVRAPAIYAKGVKRRSADFPKWKNPDAPKEDREKYTQVDEDERTLSRTSLGRQMRSDVTRRELEGLGIGPEEGVSPESHITVGEALRDLTDFWNKMLTNPLAEKLKNKRLGLKTRRPKNVLFSSDGQAWSDIIYFEEFEGSVKHLVSFHAKFNTGEGGRFFGVSGNARNPMNGIKWHRDLQGSKDWLQDAWDTWTRRYASKDMADWAAEEDPRTGTLFQQRQGVSTGGTISRMESMQQALNRDAFIAKVNGDDSFRDDLLSFISSRTDGHDSYKVHGDGNSNSDQGRSSWNITVKTALPIISKGTIKQYIKAFPLNKHTKSNGWEPTQGISIGISVEDVNKLSSNDKSLIALTRDLMTAEAYNTTDHYSMYKIDNRLDPISMKRKNFSNPAQKDQEILDVLNADPSIQGPVTSAQRGSRNYYFDALGNKIKATKVCDYHCRKPHTSVSGRDTSGPEQIRVLDF